MKIALRDAIDDAERRLSTLELPHGTGQEVVDALGSLLTDDDFWEHQSRSLVVFAAPGRLDAFRLADHAKDLVVVGDRFEIAPLLQAVSWSERAFVLQLSEGLVRLTEVAAGERVVEHPLSLPEDHALMLTHAENDGRLDRQRAQGANGDRVERERYSRAVEEEVSRIVPDDVPLVLSATTELEAAYRAVNTHPALHDDGIAPHPESLDDQKIERLARTVLDERRERETSEWKERFGTLRAQGLATSRLVEVAAAAAAAAIDELRFDLDADAAGTIDEFGRIERGEPGEAPSLVDEIASRVLHSGGTVRAVRTKDLMDGSPVAATLRFPVPSTS
nr:hypothetical protein GCM10025699_35080 [Microbacterium flavescens]